MTRKIAYWVSTGLLALLALFAAFVYLSGSPQAVQGFTHVGYPQQLRIILGIAKLLGAITLVAPGLAKLKEWAYAGFTFAWISAFIAHYLAKDGPTAFMPLVLLLLLVISYFTRPASRQLQAIKSEIMSRSCRHSHRLLASDEVLGDWGNHGRVAHDSRVGKPDQKTRVGCSCRRRLYAPRLGYV